MLGRKLNIKAYPQEKDEIINLMSLLEEDKSDTIFEVITIIYGENITDDMNIMFANFLAEVIKNIYLYANEISLRTEHAKSIGVWKDEEPEEIEKRVQKYKNNYQWNEYYRIYIQLSKHSINVLDLSLYECLIMQEEIVCDEINKSSSEILSMLDKEKNTSYIASMKKVLALCNFTLMSISCIEDIEEKYEQQTNSK